MIILIMYLCLQNPGEMLDPVTRVGNEQAFRVQLKGYIDRKMPIWIVTISIQRLHRIERMLGIEMANQVLEEIAAFLDPLQKRGNVFRNTQESFCILTLSEEEKDQIVEKIKTRFAGEWNCAESPLVVNAAIVVQQYPRDFESMEDYSEMQDYMLEQARKAKHLTVMDAAEQTIEDYRRREKVETALERALQEHKIEVFYQPIYSLKD